jgi:hypothetical protein
VEEEFFFCNYFFLKLMFDKKIKKNFW